MSHDGSHTANWTPKKHVIPVSLQVWLSTAIRYHTIHTLSTIATAVGTN